MLSRLARLEGAEEAEAVEDETVIVVTREGNPRIRSPESLAVMRAFKERHYAAWLDDKSRCDVPDRGAPLVIPSRTPP